MIPALDSVFIMMLSGLVASVWVLLLLPVWNAASSWLSVCSALVLDVLLLEVPSASLLDEAAWA